jgi:histidinol phosphatase-like PHP family hydrolase
MKSASTRQLDLVLGCFHSALRKMEDQTDRYIAALQNPDIQILDHAQNRVYNRREGLQANWHKVFAEAARLDKAVEIDGYAGYAGYADRQDLCLNLLKIAKKEGARISLGTDAHHAEQVDYIELRLTAIVLAKIPPERIISSRSSN